jgi:glucose/arabinose dehydrogenase
VHRGLPGHPAEAARVCSDSPGMKRALPAILVSGALAVLAGCGSATPSASPSTLVPIGAGLRGPSGLKAALYADGPATTAGFAFDPSGRLWITAAGLEAHKYDGVYMVPRAGARAIKVLAGLKDPIGIAWYAGRLYVASVGRVDSYGAFNGARFTQHKEVVRGPVAGAENNGLVMAPDGRFLLGITATCDHCKPASRLSAAIVSFLPDGSDVRVYAAGIRAPVGLAFFPASSDLFASMNQRDDLGAKTPGDWLALVKQGEDWRFPGCYGQGGAQCSGVPSPTAVLDKHAAVGGVAIATGQLGVGASAFVAEWASSKVQRVALTRDGSGYEGSVIPFLTGIKNPLALALAPGGGLLVGDWATGKIYLVTKAPGA